MCAALQQVSVFKYGVAILQPREQNSFELRDLQSNYRCNI